jgi:hypothetical protein
MKRRGVSGWSFAIWCAGLALLGAVPASQAQTPLGADANPADRDDPYAYGINPALADLTRDRAAAGYSILHLGFLDAAADLGSSGLTYAGRRSFGGLAAYFGHIATPLSNEFRLTAGYGHRLWHGLSLGAGVGLQQRAFSTGNFVIERPDPLYGNGLTQTVPTLSLGAAFSLPSLGLTAAGLLENPHEPHFAVDEGDDARLPRTWRVGLGVVHAPVTAAVGLVSDAWETRVDVRARWYFFGRHALTARLAKWDWSVGARIAVSDHFWVAYDYTEPRTELASESSGTQTLVVAWQRSADTPFPSAPEEREPEDVVYTAPAGGEAVAAPSAEAAADTVADVAVVADAGALAYGVAADDDTVSIRVKRLVRRFADVDPATIRRLPRWRVGVLDSTWSDKVVWSLTDGMITVTPDDQTAGGEYSPAYIARVGELVAQLRADPAAQLVVAAERSQLARARYLAERVAREAGRTYGPDGGIFVRALSTMPDSVRHRALMAPVGTDSVPAVEQITLYEYDAVGFAVRRNPAGSAATKWRLEIDDLHGRRVRTLAGEGTPPPRLRWDWRDESGRAVPGGAYRYRLGWQDGDGQRWRTPDRTLEVVRRVMQRTLTFERMPVGDLPAGTQPPLLILDGDREPAPPAEKAATETDGAGGGSGP